jgi:internalin A
MSDPEGLAIARRLIAEEARQQTGFLDLGMLGLTELPEEIHQLTHLRRLNLGDWYVSYDEKVQESANSLAANNFSNRPLPRLRFPRLVAVSLNETSVSDLTSLSGLSSLQSLLCRNTSVSDLSPLSGLTSLQTLVCRSTSVRDLSPLSALTSLQSLDCSFTLVSDLSPLSGLTSLQWLNCNYTLVSDLSPLSGLTSLQTLQGWRTSVSDLSPLSGLTSLQSLVCNHTSVSDLSPLSGQRQLLRLYCGDTSVSDLSPLSGLVSLQLLDANYCKLTEFPQALLRAERPIRLQLFETRIPGIPAEVLSQNEYNDDCRKRLLDHVTDLAAGAEPVTDVKVIVIGNGRIGKTQICNRLRGEAYEEVADSTHGIIVTQTPLPMPGDSQPALLNLWDFGGQELYHGTHALFLKSRALFVVVWTPAAENNTEYEHRGMRFRNQPLPYWLDYVRHAAGNVCPVVLVQNQCDTPQDEVLQPPADPELLKAFPYLQQVHYSAKEDRKRDSLNEALREAIRHLRGQEGITTIGKGRMRVRQQLQKWLDEDARRDRDRRQHRTLTQQQFQQLCAEVGDVSSPDSLLEYLHNAGIVFYRRGLFRDEIVLDQSWALDAIYTVFNREQCYRQLELLGGRFTRSLLEALAWPLEKYSREEQELFLSLMESCGICFWHRAADPQRQIEAEYVAPDLLPDRASIAPQLAGRWDAEAPRIERAWRFDLLSPGLVRSIISRVGLQARECAVYWKYGVWFYDATTRSSAVISQEMQDDRRGRIVLQTQGDRSRDLLESVTEWITQTIAHSGGTTCTIEGEPEMSGAETSGRLSSFAPRKNAPFAERKATISEAATSEASPAATIHITDPPRPANERQACVSYAWKEERSSDPERAGKVDEFCSKLMAKGVTIVRDNTHVALGDRLSAFMRRIGHSDRVFVFLSDAYLKSPNCMYELLTIWQTCGDDEEQFRLRTRVYTMPGTDVFSIPARLKYAAHWKKQRDEIRQVIDEHGVDVLGQTDLKHFKQIQDFAHHVNEMLAQIADVLQPREFDEYIGHAIDELNSGDS